MVLAREAQARFGLSELLVVPTGNPHFKLEQAVTAAEHRVAMLRLAFAGCTVDTREVEREGITFSVDTFAELLAEHPGAEFFFIMGTDAAASLSKWYRAEDLARMCTILAGSRPGAEVAADLFAGGPFTGEVFEFDAPDVSSSEIRARVSRGENVAALVPAEVNLYISKHGLYVNEGAGLAA